MPSLYVPAPPLNRYIRCLYYPDGCRPFAREKILPTPPVDLKINLGSRVPVYRAHQPQPVAVGGESWVMGIWNAHHIVEWSSLQHFGVSFHPGGASVFLPVPLSELHNQIVPLETLWGGDAGEIREQIDAAPTLAARFAVLEQFLLNRLGAVPDDLDAMNYAARVIARHQGVLSIRALSDDMGISQKHLIARFKCLVGTTPKEWARLYRFACLIQQLDPMQPVNWTLIAHEALYYDQSHFNHDFEAFTGHNPGDYLRLLRQAHRDNPERARQPRILPIAIG